MATMEGPARLVGIYASDGRPFRARVGLDAASSLDWSFESLGDYKFPAEGVFLLSVGGTPYKAAAAQSLLVWWGMFLEGGAVGSDELLWEFGRNVDHGLGGFFPGEPNSAFYSPGSPGKMFTYFVDMMNDGSNAGAHSVTYIAGEANRFQVMMGHTQNDDSASRVLSVLFRHAVGSGDMEFLVVGIGVGADQHMNWPLVNATVAAGEPGNVAERAVLTGAALNILSTLAAVAVSQDSRHSMRARFWGGAPTVTEAAPSGATITIDAERIEAG